MNTILRLWLRAAALFLTSILMLAMVHHGWSGYDMNKIIDITGPVIESSYENPHGHIKIKGDNVIWFVVLPPPSQMVSRGLTREMINPGVKVHIIGRPHKTEKGEMRATSITSLGKTVELR